MVVSGSELSQLSSTIRIDLVCVGVSRLCGGIRRYRIEYQCCFYLSHLNEISSIESDIEFMGVISN